MKINLTTLLTIVFVILKLTHYIDWSWFWVLSPLWITWGFYLMILSGMFLAAIIFGLPIKFKKKGEVGLKVSKTLQNLSLALILFSFVDIGLSCAFISCRRIEVRKEAAEFLITPDLTQPIKK